MACLLVAGCGSSTAEDALTSSTSPNAEETSTTSATTAPETTVPTVTISTATPPTSPPPLSADLTIVLTGTGSETTWTLTCNPDGGSHPDPAAACARIDEVGQSAFAPPPEDVMCTQQWGGPGVALVTGTLADTPVDARFSLTNGCDIARWRNLEPVLGSADA